MVGKKVEGSAGDFVFQCLFAEDWKNQVRVLNEATTRRDLIDPALAKTGWNLGNRSQVRFEIPVDGEDAEPWNGITAEHLF